MSSKIDRRLLDTNAAAMGGGVGLAVLESMFSLVQSQSVMNAAMVRDYQLSHPLAMESLAVALNEILDPFGAYYDDYDDGDGVVVPIRRARRAMRPRRAVKVRRSGGNGDGGGGGDGSGGPNDSGGPAGPSGSDDSTFTSSETMSGPDLGGAFGMSSPLSGQDDLSNGGHDNGAPTDMAELASLMREFVHEVKNAKATPAEGPEHTTTTTTKTSEHIENTAQMEGVLHNFFELMGNFISMTGEHQKHLVKANQKSLSAPKLMVT